MQRGGFGQLFGGKKQQEAEEEEEEDSAPQNPLAGLFGGAKKAKVCRLCFPTADCTCHKSLLWPGAKSNASCYVYMSCCDMHASLLFCTR